MEESNFRPASCSRLHHRTPRTDWCSRHLFREHIGSVRKAQDSLRNWYCCAILPLVCLMRKIGLEPIFNVLGHTSIFLRLFSHSKSQPWTYLCNPDFLCYFRHYPRPFSVCKGCAGLINIIHSGILCDHVPDFNIDGILLRTCGMPARLIWFLLTWCWICRCDIPAEGFNVFSLAFWKATSKTFRAWYVFQIIVCSSMKWNQPTIKTTIILSKRRGF